MRSKKKLSQINNETRVFYVDSLNGNDQNSGLSENEPLQTLDAAFGNTLYAGNKVLLKSGGTYAGGVKLTANGTEEKPIVISSYGDGEKPVINDFDNDIGIKVYGEYVEISNLEFTATKGVNGITCYALDGAVKGIKITDCDFHNINTGFNKTNYSSGGITLSATGVKPCWFEDALIENNTFDTVARTAVNLDTHWCAKDKNQEWGSNIIVNGNGERDSANSPVYYSKNITVRGNEIKNNGGDAILLIGAEDSIVEYNTVEDSGLFKNVGKTIHWASIWFHSSRNCIAQYNSVKGNSDKNGAADLQAYDSDIACENIIFQYNYSENNAGGFMLICSGVKDENAANKGTIVRYNVSVNDGYDTLSGKARQVIDIVDYTKNAHIYNNTIYSSKENVVLVQFADYDGKTDDDKIPPKDNILTNNLFYVEEGVTNTAFRMWDTEDATATLNNNLFYGVDIPEISGITVENSVKADLDLDSDYRPATDLSGVAIENNGGKDYNGNDLSGKNIIGALLAVK